MSDSDILDGNTHIMKVKGGFFILMLLLTFIHANSRNYYVSPNGNDHNNGLSIRSAIKTIDRINKLVLKPGDTVFFERGKVFIGSISIRQSGTKNQPIVIAGYGEGAAPIITGAVVPNKWEQIQPNVFEAYMYKEVFDLYSNSIKYTPARFPNSGYLTIEKGFGKDSILNNQLTQPTGYWNDATLRIRTIDWVYETRKIKYSEAGLLVQGSQNRYFIDRGFLPRMQNGQTSLYDFQKGYGFFLEGLMSLVDTAYEWSWQNGKLRLQLPSGKRPEDLYIQAVTEGYGIFLLPYVKHINIEGLYFRHFEKAGIGGGWHLQNINISDNQFQQIHGSGVWLDSASLQCTIKNNQFQDILGRGISAIEPVYLSVQNNIIRRIGLSRGHGWSGVNGASAIVIYNNERRKSLDSTYANHNTVRLNRIDSCGYIGIRVDGNYNLVENNVIDNCSLTLNDGANLYCFATEPGITHHSIFRNNIVRYSIGDSEMTPANPNLAFGIYLDNNSHDMLVEGNTVIGTNAAGITNNDASFRNTIKNNLTYNCKEGIGFAEWANLGRVFDCVVDGNTFVAKVPEQKAVRLVNFIGPVLEVGVFDHNTYINSGATQFFHFETKQVPQNSKLDLSFMHWQRMIGGDENSTAITAVTQWALGLTATVLVNDESVDKYFEFNTDKIYYADGSVAPNRVRVLPYSSQVVLLKEVN